LRQKIKKHNKQYEKDIEEYKKVKINKIIAIVKNITGTGRKVVI
jgi:hypothetical protein